MMNFNPYTLSGNYEKPAGLETTVMAALRVLKEQPCALSMMYFSDANIQGIQQRFIRDTKRITGVTIGKQSAEELLTIMIGIYVTYSMYTGDNEKEETARLNQLVYAEGMKQILPGVRSVRNYFRDASANYGGVTKKAFARPQSTSVKGSKVLPGFLGLQKN